MAPVLSQTVTGLILAAFAYWGWQNRVIIQQVFASWSCQTDEILSSPYPGCCSLSVEFYDACAQHGVSVYLS